jgi:hypothetical protein
VRTGDIGLFHVRPGYLAVDSLQTDQKALCPFTPNIEDLEYNARPAAAQPFFAGRFDRSS